MIIIAYKPGQLANRLFLFAKFLAYSYEYGLVILNPSFDDYASYFKKTKHQFIPASRGFSGFSLKYIIKFIFGISYYISRALHWLKFDKGLLSVTYLDWSEHYNLDDDVRLKRRGVHFIQGWGFNSSSLLKLHKPAIIDFFYPEEMMQDKIDDFYKHLKNPKRLIGVHIRQGDYRYFEGGKYFYELHQYISVMTSLAEQYAGSSFLVSTNNKSICGADFETLDVTISPGHELIDLYLLAKCNYIIGPPSTYSQWASFYGDVPLYHIKDIHCSIELKDFKLADE